MARYAETLEGAPYEGVPSATESAEEGIVMNSLPPQPKSRHGRLAAIGGTAMLAAVGATAWSRGGITSKGEGTVGLEVGGDPVPAEFRAPYQETKGYGCKNWASMETARLTATRDECHFKCMDLDGCTAFNYQEDECSGAEQHGPNTCLLFTGTCEKEINTCWNLYEMQSYYPEPPWKKVKNDTGCSNWAIANLGTTKELNHNACGYACHNDTRCIGFNWQQQNCRLTTSDETKGTDYDGACMLFFNNCTWEENSCWDFYEKQPSRHTKYEGVFLLKAASPGDTLLHTNGNSDFAVGEEVTISTRTPNYWEKGTISALGSIVLVDGLSKAYPPYSPIRRTCKVLDGTSTSSNAPCGCAHKECSATEYCLESADKCLISPITAAPTAAPPTEAPSASPTPPPPPISTNSAPPPATPAPTQAPTAAPTGAPTDTPTPEPTNIPDCVPDDWFVTLVDASAAGAPDTLIVQPFYSNPTKIPRNADGKPLASNDPQCLWRYEKDYTLCTPLGQHQYTKVQIGSSAIIGDVNCKFQANPSGCSATQPITGGGCGCSANKSVVCAGCNPPSSLQSTYMGNAAKHWFPSAAADAGGSLTGVITNDMVTNNPDHTTPGTWWYVYSQSTGGGWPDPGGAMAIGQPYCGVRFADTTLTFRTKSISESDCPAGCPAL